MADSLIARQAGHVRVRRVGVGELEEGLGQRHRRVRESPQLPALRCRLDELHDLWPWVSLSFRRSPLYFIGSTNYPQNSGN